MIFLLYFLVFSLSTSFCFFKKVRNYSNNGKKNSSVFKDEILKNLISINIFGKKNFYTEKKINPIKINSGLRFLDFESFKKQQISRDLFNNLLNCPENFIHSIQVESTEEIKIKKKTVSFAAKIESFLYYKTDKTNLKEMMQRFEENKTPILKNFENNLKLDTDQKKLFYLNKENLKKEKENFLCVRSLGWDIEKDNKLESDIEKIDGIKNCIFVSRSVFAIPLVLFHQK